MNREPNSKREYISRTDFHALINSCDIIAVKMLDNSTHSADRTADTAMGAAMFGTAGAIVGSALGDQKKGSITVVGLCQCGKEYLCEYKPGSDDLLRGWEDNKKMLLPLFKEEWPQIKYDRRQHKEMLERGKAAEWSGLWRGIKIAFWLWVVVLILHAFKGD